MNVSIMIVSYRRDFRYLVYTLKSLRRFARGFREVVISVPQVDLAELNKLIASTAGSYDNTTPVRVRGFDEWPGKGMLHHMFVILHADHVCHQPDFVLHMDSDHVFTAPVTPDNYIRDGKADFVYAKFKTLCPPEHYEDRAKVKIEPIPGVINWWMAGFRAMGVDDEFEFMRRAPLVHARAVYEQTRRDIEQHTSEPLAEFVRDQRNKYPQTFAEFQCLGSVAFRKFHDLYNWYRQEDGDAPPGYVYDAWTHRPPTEQDMAKYKELGL